VCVKQPKTLEERIQVAKNFVNDYGFQLPIFVDNMDNVFDERYGAWPERFYIFDENGLMKFAGFPENEFGYEREQIIQWLNENKVIAN